MDIKYKKVDLPLTDEVLALLNTTESDQARIRKAWTLGEHFCAFDGEKIIGAAVVNTNESVAELTNIAVEQGYQCKGVARKLIEKIKDFALTLGKSQLKVDTDRTSAHQFEFYQKWGFRPYQEACSSDVQQPNRVMIIDL